MKAPLPPEWQEASDQAPPPPELPCPDSRVYWKALHCKPIIDPSAWVAPGAAVFGRVRLKARASVWYSCVLRGDEEYIEVGEDSNIQDGSVLHIDHGYACIVGDRVTIGHQATVHACTVGDDALIGIQATILSRAVIGQGAVIGAGAVVTEGCEVPPHTLWVGCPAKQIKEIQPALRERLAETYKTYVNSGQTYLKRYGRAHIDALMDL